MQRRIASLCVIALVAATLSSTVSAQTWSAEQQEVWRLEEQQWQMAAAEDLGWIDSMVHPNISYWDVEQPMPQNLASLKKWNRYDAANSATLEHELHPISLVITGNIAVVNYYYTIASEDFKKERKTTTGRYMDVLMKENGRWRFIAWAGGDNPTE